MPLLGRIGLSQDFTNRFKKFPEFIRTAAKQLGKMQLQKMHPNNPENILLDNLAKEGDKAAIEKLEFNREISKSIANDLTTLDSREGRLIGRFINDEMNGSKNDSDELKKLKEDLSRNNQLQEIKIGSIHQNYSTLISMLFERNPQKLGNYRFLVKRSNDQFCLIEFKPDNSLEIRKQKGLVVDNKENIDLNKLKPEEGTVLISDSYLLNSKYSKNAKYINLSDTPESLEGIRFLGIIGFGDSTKQYLKVTGPISSSYPNTISSRLIADFVSRLKKTLPIKSNERIPEGCVIGYKLIAGSEPEFYNLGTFTRIIKKNSC